MDALKEIANIGAGHAATALSQLLGKKVDMCVPQVDLIPLEAVADYFGKPDTQVWAVFTRCETPFPVSLVFIMEKSDGDLLSEWLFNFARFPRQSRSLPGMRESALSESGNILMGAFVSAVGDLLGKNLPLSVPSITLDLMGSVMDILVEIFGCAGDTALATETELSFPGERRGGCRAKILLIPDPGALGILFRLLGVD
ncbi:MAG: chemotaxis protein CheC [Synergistales bacterium]